VYHTRVTGIDRHAQGWSVRSPSAVRPQLVPASCLKLPEAVPSDLALSTQPSQLAAANAQVVVLPQRRRLAAGPI